jgi:hypothetical protein
MFRDPFYLAVLLLGRWAVRCGEDAGGRFNAPGPRALGILETSLIKVKRCLLHACTMVSATVQEKELRA